MIVYRLYKDNNPLFCSYLVTIETYILYIYTQLLYIINIIVQPGWLSSLAPPSAQGMILETWDRVPHQAPYMKPAPPSACFSASLSLCVCVSKINKILKKNYKHYTQLLCIFSFNNYNAYDYYEMSVIFLSSQRFYNWKAEKIINILKMLFYFPEPNFFSLWIEVLPSTIWKCRRIWGRLVNTDFFTCLYPQVPKT